MTTVITHRPSHAEQKWHSFDNLQKIRLHATKNSEYSPETIHEALTEECLIRCDHKPPYPWQLDAAEAFHLGLDCVIIAGTGSGKSLPFVMPSMLKINLQKVLVVLSPLNALEVDQAGEFNTFHYAKLTCIHFIDQKVSEDATYCCGYEPHHIHWWTASGEPAKS